MLGNPQIKIVVTGDGTVGKTCLLHMYATNKFPEKYDATIFDNYVTKVQIDSETIYKVCLWDTAGQESLDNLRPLSYSGAHVVLICFDVTNPNSFQHLKSKWAVEAKHHLRNDVPIVVVGTKTDLRHDETRLQELQRNGETYLTPQDGYNIAKEIGAKTYVECSALKCHGVKEVFDEAITEGILYQQNSQANVPSLGSTGSCCFIL
eukprot:TRINITY_DN2252_c0_g1_i2.p2 TRINITY_DN2252_c0_g1~~TRINITY_DN2252_c0_g1_i2.p2  ORF type:complete len:206 (+),score=30.81 TRINITY_DN2252_c0_g1_i2:182-799(+)